MRSYTELVGRCKELKLSPCKGTRDILNAKVEAAEALLNNRDDIKAESRTLALPTELIQYEVLRHLDFVDLLAYCSTNLAARVLCQKERLLEKKIEGLSYWEFRNTVLYWGWSGLRTTELIDVMVKHKERLDLHTVRLVYLYLEEQGLESEALKLKGRYIETMKMSKLLKDEIFPDKKVYDLLNELLRTVRTKNGHPIDVWRPIRKAIDLMPEDYLGYLLANAMSDEDVLTFMAIVKEYGKEHKYKIQALLPFLYWFSYALHRKDRLTESIHDILTERPFYLELRGITDSPYEHKDRRYSFSPDAIRKTINYFQKIPIYSADLVDPITFVDILLSIADQTEREEALNSFFHSFYDKQTVYHHQWINETVKELRRRGVNTSKWLEEQ